MAWIKTIPPQEAAGPLKRVYDAAVARAGKVWQIVRLMGLRPRQLQASMGLYQELMHGTSGLSRTEREMVAVVVSRANRCRY